MSYFLASTRTAALPLSENYHRGHPPRLRLGFTVTGLGFRLEVSVKFRAVATLRHEEATASSLYDR